MKTALIIYSITSVIFSIIAVAIQYRKYGKTVFKTIIAVSLSSELGKMFKKVFLNWYGITFFIIPAVAILCQVAIPYWLFRKIKKLIAHKPKINKIAKAEMEDFVWLHESE
jgi:hypothetical protein